MSLRCIVLGGSGTVGGSVVQALASRGAQVGLTYCHSKAKAKGLSEELGRRETGASTSLPVQRLDLSELETVEARVEELAQTLGGLDSLVVAAGQTSSHLPADFDAFESVDLAGFSQLLNVNVAGAFAACRAAARQMNKGGNIVLLGSVDSVKPVPGPVPHTASKAALTGMTQTLAKVLGSQDIRINVVAPGILSKGASRTLPESMKQDYLAHCGLRRFGTPEEIANVVSWLCLENTYLTGQALLLDGGL